MFELLTTGEICSPSASADGRRLKPGSSLPGDDPGRSPREKWGNPCFRVEGNYLTIPRGLRDLRKNAFENRGVAEVAEQLAEKTSGARSFRTASHSHGSWSGLAPVSRFFEKQRCSGLPRLPALRWYGGVARFALLPCPLGRDGEAGLPAVKGFFTGVLVLRRHFPLFELCLLG